MNKKTKQAVGTIEIVSVLREKSEASLSVKKKLYVNLFYSLLQIYNYFLNQTNFFFVKVKFLTNKAFFVLKKNFFDFLACFLVYFSFLN
jgi:hypothetical protein